MSLEHGGARGASRGGAAKVQNAVWSGEPSRAKVRLVALATVSQSMTTSFYAYDLQGNVTTLTDTAGNVVGSYAYDAWGNVVSSALTARAQENPYRFSTKEQIGGLYHFGYRFYDAGTGRWLNRDPLEENGGVNLYGFNHNNPIKYIDPDGACPQAAMAVVGALGGALIGGGMAWYRGEDIGRGAFRGAVIGGVAGLTGGMAGSAVSGLVGGGFLGGAAAGALGGAAGDAVGQAAEIGLGWRCSYDWKQTAMAGALGGLTGGLSSAKIACFVRGTHVVMADGTTKSIEQVKVGDSVQSRDEATGKTEAKKVTRTFERQVETTLVLRFSNGEKIETTKEHPFYVEGRGFVPAGEMGIGTSIVTRAGPSVKLTQVEVKNAAATVYNFQVEDFHTYFVGQNGLWVHNDCPGVGKNLGEAMEGSSLKPGSQGFVYKNVVDNYISQLKSDAGKVWSKPIGEKIIISSDGIILNGFHRVVAAHLAGFNIPESAIFRSKMASAMERTWSDVIVRLNSWESNHLYAVSCS